MKITIQLLIISLMMFLEIKYFYFTPSLWYHYLIMYVFNWLIIIWFKTGLGLIRGK